MKKIINKFKFSKKQLVIVGLAAAVFGSVIIGSSFADTPPRLYYVSNSGNDAAAGSEQAPFKTIQRAARAVKDGDTVIVLSGVYPEAVLIEQKASGATFKGQGDTKPVVDGENKRSYGFSLTGGVHHVTIDNFEIKNMTAGGSGRAAGILGHQTHSSQIINNHIHDIHATNPYSYGIVLGHNSVPGSVYGMLVKNNRIHNIGPGGESHGVWLMYTKNVTIDNNEIYLVRKEGVRDWEGRDNIIINNRSYLNWIGINLNGGTGTLVANNVSYANVYGYNPKHVSSPQTLGWWGIKSDTPGLWSKFWHNTSYGNTHADMALGMNAPPEDYIDVRNNLFASPGDVHLHDFPGVRGKNIIVDGNAYTGSRAMYYTGWNWPPADRVDDFASLKAKTGWEPKGQVFKPVFKDPSKGDFSFDTTGLSKGVDLDSPWGNQVGARQTTTSSNSWISYPAIVLDSSPVPNKQGASDKSNDSYWYGKTYNKNGWFVMDLGSAKPINTFVLNLFGHADSRAPKTMNVQVSNDSATNFGAPVFSTVNPDNKGSSYKYSLEGTITARYIKVNIVDNFGGSGIVFSDFQAGLLQPLTTSNIPTTPPPNQAPTVVLNSSSQPPLFEPASISLNATSSDSDGTVSKVEFFNGTTKLGEDTEAPYQFNWHGVVKGDYSLTARSTDNKGASTTSAPINIKVEKKETPPPSACSRIEDLFCDQKVNFQDLSALLIKISSRDEKADVNKDGIVNFQDISYILGRFDR